MWLAVIGYRLTARAEPIDRLVDRSMRNDTGSSAVNQQSSQVAIASERMPERSPTISIRINLSPGSIEGRPAGLLNGRARPAGRRSGNSP
jgi:hypothetical protein